MSFEADVKPILGLLVESIKEELDSVEASNSIEKSWMLYHRVKTKQFIYDSDNGVISYYAPEDEDFKRLEWSAEDRHQTIELIKNSKKFQELAKKLKLVVLKAYSALDEDNVAVPLQRAFTPTIERMVKLGASEEMLDDHLNAFISDLDDHLNAFISDLTGEPLKVYCKMWVEGVSLEDDAYDIFDGLKIRRTVPSDLETEESILDPASRVWRPEPGRRMAPVIIEYTFMQERNGEIGRKPPTLLDCLRLFGLGSLYSRLNEWISKSSNLTFPTMTLPDRPSAPMFKYRIYGEDIPKLGVFIRAVENVLPESCSSFDPNVKPECIPLLRYEDALLKGENPEARVASAVMCLEALYLRDSEDTELSRRLKQRGATTLAFLGLDSLLVYEKLGDAYEVRSSYVHGSSPRKKIRNKYKGDFRGLAREVLDYARCSLIICLVAQKSLNIAKERLIQLIDNSLLDNKSREELKKIICAACTMRRQDEIEKAKEEAQTAEPHNHKLKTCFLDNVPFKIPSDDVPQEAPK